MTTTVQIKATGASGYSEVEKKDFLGALEDCDSVNDIILINGASFVLSTIIFCDCEAVPTTGTTTTSSVADVYTATGTLGAVVLSTGLRVALNVNRTNTGAATVNFDGTGVKAIQLDGVALAGRALAAGQRYPLIYDGAAFQMVSSTSIAAEDASMVSAPDTEVDAAGNPVALSVKTKNTKLTTTVAQLGTFTLADGVEGQEKRIFLGTKGGAVTGVVTPANLHGFTFITFTNVGDSILLVFIGTKWAIIGGTAVPS